jgi:hypothetical protein
MRAVGWGVVAALTLLAGAASVQAQPPKGKGMPEGWWNDLWGPSKPKPRDDPQPGAASVQLSPDDRDRQLDRLEKALMRREAVCTKLQEIADATGNAALAEEAMRLLEATYALHNRQVRALGVAVQAPPRPDEAARPPVSLPAPGRAEEPPARYRSGVMDAGMSVPPRSLEGER